MKLRAKTPIPTDKQQAYIYKIQKRQHAVSIAKLLILIVFLLQWEITAQLQVINSFIFSCPSRIISTMFSMLKDGALLFHIGITLCETLVSFALVTVFSIGIALLLWYFTFVAEICEPYLVILNSLPKSALAPLLIVWFGTGFKTIVICGISVSLFGSILQLYESFIQTDPDLYKLIYTLQGKKYHILRYILLPDSLPVILAGMKVNIGLCLVGVVIGEFLAARQGLGYLIIYGSQVFKLDWVLMSIFLLCLIAMGLYRTISFIEARYCAERT